MNTSMNTLMNLQIFAITWIKYEQTFVVVPLVVKSSTEYDIDYIYHKKSLGNYVYDGIFL